MTKKRAQAAPTMMLRVEQAFMDFGYSGLSMIGLAKACDLTARTLYNYFSNKEEAFRGVCRFRNELNIQRGFEAGAAVQAQSGSALDILSEIINVRYGDTRRIANASPHLIDLNAEIFKRCNDIVTEVALSFEDDLSKVIAELEHAGLLQYRAGVTPEQLSRALCNGARGVNQRLPPCPPSQLAENYREICQFVLNGGTEWLAPAPSSNKEQDNLMT